MTLSDCNRKLAGLHLKHKSQIITGLSFLLAAIFLIGLGWFAARETGETAAREIDQNLNHRITLYKDFLQRELNQVDYIAAILAQNPQLIAALQPNGAPSYVDVANNLLKTANQKLETATVFLMDRNGRTVAASNFDQEHSFVGKNYSFRPYFKDALEKGTGRFLAVGITSYQLGYYVAHAIKNGGETVGVIVIKIDLRHIQQFTKDMDGDYFIADGRNIIFLSSNKTFELKSLSTISANDRRYISRTRQYPIHKIETLENHVSDTKYGSLNTYRINYNEYFVKKVSLDELNWTVWLFSPTAPIQNQALSSAIGITLIGLMVMIAFYLLYKRRKDSERFQTIVDNLPSGVTFFDNNLQMLICNEMVKKVLDFPDTLFHGGLPSLRTLLHFNAQRGEYGENNPDLVIAEQIEKAKKRIDHVFERKRPDGTILEIRGVWVDQGLITTYTDITDRKKAEEEAMRTSGYLRALLHNMDQGVTVTDENLNIVFWNNAFFDLLKLPDHLKKPVMKYEDLIRYNAIRGEYGPGDPEQHVKLRVQASLKFEPHKFERTRPDGHTLQVTGKPLHIDGEPFGFISTYVDITEHKRMATRLRKLANTDPLTELSNRRHFTTLLEREIKRSRRNGNPLSLLLLDLDHFKTVNDRFGHNCGDMALKAFADTSRDILRDIDVIGRLGGEEFCIFLPDTDREGAYILAERMRQGIENIDLVSEKNEPIKLTVSIGVAMLDNVMGDRIEDILQRADKALYRAKHEGRNRVC